MSDSARARQSSAWWGWWLLAGLAIGVHLIALYLPGTPDGAIELPWLPGSDKIVHALLFAIPVYLVGWLFDRIWAVAAMFAAHAVISELIQARFVAYRDGDPWDAVADVAGIAIAVALLLWRRRRDRR